MTPGVGVTFCCKECRKEYSKQFKTTKNCEFCNKLFEFYSNHPKKYCSNECYHKAPKKEKTIEQREAIKKRTEDYYKITPLEILEKRWNNIGKANKVYLTPEELFRLEEVLKLGYIRDKNLLFKAAKIEGKSYKAMNNHMTDNPNWIKQFKMLPGGGLDWQIQSLNPEEFKQLLLDLGKHTIGYIKEKWGIGEKPQNRLRKFYNIHKKYRINYKESRPEAIVRGILEELNVLFIREKYVCRRFVADFLIGNKVIEVQGDYWHGNPEVYTDQEKLNDIQWANKMNDSFKREWLIRNNYEVLYIWEKELDNIKFVEEKIKDYLCIK